jgi:hypothetical protein
MEKKEIRNFSLIPGMNPAAAIWAASASLITDFDLLEAETESSLVEPMSSSNVKAVSERFPPRFFLGISFFFFLMMLFWGVVAVLVGLSLGDREPVRVDLPSPLPSHLGPDSSITRSLLSYLHAGPVTAETVLPAALMPYMTTTKVVLQYTLSSNSTAWHRAELFVDKAGFAKAHKMVQLDAAPMAFLGAVPRAVAVWSGSPAASWRELVALSAGLVALGEVWEAVVYVPASALPSVVEAAGGPAGHRGVTFRGYGASTRREPAPAGWLCAAAGRACSGAWELFKDGVEASPAPVSELARAGGGSARFILVDRLALPTVASLERAASLGAIDRSSVTVALLCTSLPYDSDSPAIGEWSALPAPMSGLRRDMDVISRMYSLPLRPLFYASTLLAGSDALRARYRSGEPLSLSALPVWSGTGTFPLLVTASFAFEVPRPVAPGVGWVGSMIEPVSTPPVEGAITAVGLTGAELKAMFGNKYGYRETNRTDQGVPGSLLACPCKLDLVQFGLLNGAAVLCVPRGIPDEDVAARLRDTRAGLVWHHPASTDVFVANRTDLIARARQVAAAMAAESAGASPARRVVAALRRTSFLLQELASPNISTTTTTATAAPISISSLPEASYLVKRWSIDVVFLLYAGWGLLTGLLRWVVGVLIRLSKSTEEQDRMALKMFEEVEKKLTEKANRLKEGQQQQQQQPKVKDE